MLFQAKLWKIENCFSFPKKDTDLIESDIQEEKIKKSPSLPKKESGLQQIDLSSLDKKNEDISADK